MNMILQTQTTDKEKFNPNHGIHVTIKINYNT